MHNLEKLPALPDGWHYEDGSAIGADVVHIVWSEHGAVSVNLKERTFSYGWNRPTRAGKFVGKGWKDRLIDAAIGSLRDVWA